MANVGIIEKKSLVVDGLREKIGSASILLISDFRGVSVKQLTELRKKLYAADAEYKVVKNTLLRRAFSEVGHDDLNTHLEGPVGILLGYKEPIAPLKALVEFFEEAEKGEIKAGLVEKEVVDQSGIKAMAKLPPREVLLARVVGGLQSPIYGLVNVLQGNIRKLVYALNAIREKKGG